MSRLLVILVGMLLLAALLYLCITTRPPRIQADVLACVETRLANIELTGVEVGVDGRDVRLAGTVGDADAKSRAGDAAAERCGARVVVNDIAVAPAQAYRTSICIDRSGLRMTGAFPDETALEEYLETAAQRLGDVRLASETTLRPDAPAGFDRLMTSAFAELAQMDEGCIELMDSDVTVSGKMRSAVARDRLIADIDRAAGDDFRVAFDLSVPELSATAKACQEALDGLLAPGAQVLFDFDSAELHEAGRRLLDEAEEIWSTCPDIALIVAGHTDSVGDAEYNRELSERRARAVVEYLVAQGFDRSRLTPVGFGEAQPQASNETEEGRALNRRMEFRVRESAQ